MESARADRWGSVGGGSPDELGPVALTEAAHSPSRHFAATQQLGRIWSEADIERFSVCAEPVAFDPKPTSPLKDADQIFVRAAEFLLGQSRQLLGTPAFS